MISNNIFTSDIISGYYFHADGNVDIDGNLKVDGDFTVNGTTSTVNSITLTVDDKNIELGSVDTPTNVTADGGGITLKGATDKEFKWTNASNSWNSSENLGIADGKYLFTDKVRARDGAGLSLKDDGGNGIFIKDGGNVGIGTTSPASHLHVVGQGYFTRSSSTSAPLYAKQDGTGPSAYFMGGNVGIGTTSPISKTHIGDGHLLISQSSNTTQENILLQGAGYRSGTQDALYGNVSIRSNYANSTNSASLNFYTAETSTSTTERMRITSNGNVGIGTTSPTQKLSVDGNLLLSKTDIDGGNEALLFNSGGSADHPLLRIYDKDGDTGAAITANGNSYLSAKGGNVGIGTTNPNSKLVVKGDQTNEAQITIVTDNTAGPKDAILYLNATRGTGNQGSNATITATHDGASALAKMLFATRRGNNLTPETAMAIDSSGNVGIGTTSPEMVLSIKTDAYAFSISSEDHDHIVYAGKRSSSEPDSGYLRLKNQTSTKVALDSAGDSYFNGGNVGIGITSPQQKLHVSGNTRLDGAVEISGDLVVIGTTTTNNVETVSTSNGVVFEGSATDNNEGLLKAGTLTADRTYTLPNKSGTVAMTTDIPTTPTISNSTITITAGGALTGGGSFTLNGSGGTITLNHQDTSSQGSSNNSGRTYIQDIGLDAYGHVTSIGTATETIDDTTYSAGSGLDLSATNVFSVESDLRGEIEYVGSSRSYIRATDAYTATLPFVGPTTLPPQLTFFVDSDQTTDDGARVVFQSDGDVHVEADVVAFSSVFSDKKLKDNIGQIKGGLEKVKKLRGVEFDWNATSRKGTKDIGVIAQEVEQVIPEVVSEKVPCVGEFCENTEKYKTVDYSKLVPVLIEAIKDLSEEVEELKKKLS